MFFGATGSSPNFTHTLIVPLSASRAEKAQLGRDHRLHSNNGIRLLSFSNSSAELGCTGFSGNRFCCQRLANCTRSKASLYFVHFKKGSNNATGLIQLTVSVLFSCRSLASPSISSMNLATLLGTSSFQFSPANMRFRISVAK